MLLSHARHPRIELEFVVEERLVDIVAEATAQACG